MSLAAARPDDVRSAAARLRHAAELADSAAWQLARDAERALVAWWGAAAEGTGQDWQRQVALLRARGAEGPRRLAAALDRWADSLEDLQQRALRVDVDARDALWSLRQRQWIWETAPADRRGPHPPPTDVVLAPYAQQREQLELEAEQAGRALAAVAGSVESLLAVPDPAERAGAVAAAWAHHDAAQAARAAAVGTLARARDARELLWGPPVPRPGGPVALAREARARAAARVPSTAVRVGAAVGRLAPVLPGIGTAVSAGVAWHGSGADGVRGVVDRAVAIADVAASAAPLVALLFPATAPVAGALVLAAFTSKAVTAVRAARAVRRTRAAAGWYAAGTLVHDRAFPPAAPPTALQTARRRARAWAVQQARLARPTVSASAPPPAVPRYGPPFRPDHRPPPPPDFRALLRPGAPLSRPGSAR